MFIHSTTIWHPDYFIIIYSIFFISSSRAVPDIVTHWIFVEWMDEWIYIWRRIKIFFKHAFLMFFLPLKFSYMKEFMFLMGVCMYMCECIYTRMLYNIKYNGWQKYKYKLKFPVYSILLTMCLEFFCVYNIEQYL